MPPVHAFAGYAGGVGGNSKFKIQNSKFRRWSGVRIVLVRLSALGDIVHTWPLACELASLDSRPHLSWVVEEPLKSLVEGHPAVDAVFTTQTRRWRREPLAPSTRAEAGSLKTRLRELQADYAVDPQGTTKSAMIVRWTGAERKIGLARPWRREWLAGLAYDLTVPGAPGQSHVVATNLAMVRALDASPAAIAPPDGTWLLEKVADRAPTGEWSTPYAVLLPGTGGAHKALDEATVASVARGLVGEGLAVVVAWGPGEQERASAVVASAGSGVFLAPATDIEELAGLLGGAVLVIGGDTGPVHLAASFGTPTLAVFLASDPRRNGPLGPRTAVVSGAEDAPSGPTGSARTRPGRRVDTAEILGTALDLISI